MDYLPKVKARAKKLCKAFRKIVYGSIWDATISFNKSLFLDYLQTHGRHLVVTRFNHPGMFDWFEETFPKSIDDFGDLSFLFWMTPLNRGLLRQDFDEAFELYKTIASMSQPKGVEVGRYFGGSTLLLAHAVRENGKVLSIDISPQNDGILISLLERYGFLHRTELVVSDANLVEVDYELDFVFIDGDHSYEGARRDHNKWAKQVKVGGFVIHHDMANSRPYATQWETLARLRREILAKQDSQLKLVREVGSLSIFQRISDQFTEI